MEEDSNPDAVDSQGSVTGRSESTGSSLTEPGPAVESNVSEPPNLTTPTTYEKNERDPEGATNLLERLDGLHDLLEHGFAALQAEFREKIAFDRVREQQLAALSTELQEYRSDVLGKALRPLLVDVIRLHGEISKRIRSLHQRPPEESENAEVARVLSEVQEDIEILLGRYDVLPYVVETDTVDPRRHIVIRTISTDDRGLAGQIAERLSPGFERESIILERERVTAYKLNPDLVSRGPALPATDVAAGAGTLDGNDQEGGVT